jgi:saccharopine dehydrogenase-like NADP-dependent oxidoreductase
MGKIIILGSGMVGSAMAFDLANNHEVTITDLSVERLNQLKQKNHSVQFVQLDVTNHDELKKTIANHDLVICAVPGFLGFETIKQIILANKMILIFMK